MRSARLDVTLKHINAGEKENCYACPIALAAKELFGKPVTATPNGIWDYIQEQTALLGHVNNEIREFMEIFDAGCVGMYKPFSTDIVLTEEGAAQIARMDTLKSE